MATSGSTDYTLTAREVATQSLRLIRVTPVFDTPSAEDLTQAIATLNLMLKGWETDGPHIAHQTEGSVAVVAATPSYSLSPRPYRLIEARYRDANGRDLPMHELTRAEYFEFPIKTTQGTPTQYYYDPQVSTGTLYVWPVLAAATTETIQYTYQRVFEDIDNPANNLDIPQEWLDMVVYNLADRLLDVYGKDNDRITKRAMMLLRQAKDMDREPVVRFQPGIAH